MNRLMELLFYFIAHRNADLRLICEQTLDCILHVSKAHFHFRIYLFQIIFSKLLKYILELLFFLDKAFYFIYFHYNYNYYNFIIRINILILYDLKI